MGEDDEIEAWINSAPYDPIEDALTKFAVKKSRRAKLRPIIEYAIRQAMAQPRPSRSG